MRTDLHIHTTASDGCWTPQRLIKGIVEKKIELFAVTDHDTVENVSKMEMLSQSIPGQFIKGVEINSKFQGGIIHILGYGIDPKTPQLEKVLVENRNQLDEVNIRDIQKVITLGYPIRLSDYLSYTYDLQRGGWKSLNFLIDQKICRDLKDYNKNLRSEIGHYVPEFMATEDVVRVIREAGGIPILAHPGASLRSVDIEDGLNQILGTGIAGVECFAQYHNEETTRRCVDWCQEHVLLITGGSDYHGGFVNRTLGEPVVDHAIELNLGAILPG